LLAQEVAEAAVSGTLTQQQYEYLRVLQENQLLRQYLSQMQALVQLQAQHAAALAASQAQHATASPAAPAPSSNSAVGADGGWRACAEAN
jgi:hypothetical protein